jgi:hypothetical protein
MVADYLVEEYYFVVLLLAHLNIDLKMMIERPAGFEFDHD